MPSYNLSGSFTIAVWLKYNSLEERNATILSNSKAGGHGFILKIFDKSIIFRRAYTTGEEIFKTNGMEVDSDKCVNYTP